MAVDITIKCRSFKKRLNKRYEFIIYRLFIPKFIKIIRSRKNEQFQRYRIGKNLTFFVFEVSFDDGLINDKILFVFQRTYSCLDICLVTMKYVQDVF